MTSDLKQITCSAVNLTSLIFLSAQQMMVLQSDEEPIIHSAYNQIEQNRHLIICPAQTDTQRVKPMPARR